MECRRGILREFEGCECGIHELCVGLHAPQTLPHATVMRQPRHAGHDLGPVVGVRACRKAVHDKVRGFVVERLHPLAGIGCMIGCMLVVLCPSSRDGLTGDLGPFSDRDALPSSFSAQARERLDLEGRVAFGAGRFHGMQARQSAKSPVPAFTITRPRPRQRAHVLLGKASMPFEQENVGGFTLAGSESTTALISLGALDKEAPRLVVETWPFAPLADSAGVELIACSFIVGHACTSHSRSSCLIWSIVFMVFGG